MVHLTILFYLGLPLIQPDLQTDLNNIVALYKSLGHPAVSSLGTHTSPLDSKLRPVGYVFFWHPPANTVASDELRRPGGRVFIISMPEGVKPSPEALRGVKTGGKNVHTFVH